MRAGRVMSVPRLGRRFRARRRAIEAAEHLGELLIRANHPDLFAERQSRRVRALERDQAVAFPADRRRALERPAQSAYRIPSSDEGLQLNGSCRTPNAAPQRGALRRCLQGHELCLPHRHISPSPRAAAAVQNKMNRVVFFHSPVASLPDYRSRT
jgi:hypothetical protein